ncbi:hypothetical protein HPB50_009161 [Hyalomma asiaticum]|uniref:Uncharacterized protein n=1 Tax=Hyalomma asiaticum TaxID=266040 RepID=A0ACB7SXC9_HYAAI|nr:hypothetical protein HPB50_009161 [Hyalomma asiaticum]
MAAPAAPETSYSVGSEQLPSRVVQQESRDYSGSGFLRAMPGTTGCSTGHRFRCRRGGTGKPFLEHIENLGTPLLCHRVWSRGLGAGLVLLSFLVLALGAWALWSAMELRRDPEAMVGCRSAGCHDQIAWLAMGLDPSADPCSDADAYVCGRIRWQSEDHANTMDDMRRRWYLEGSRFLEKHQRPAAAFALYNACMSETVQASAGSESMMSFLVEIGLPWPYISSGRHRHFLDVILDLCINWGVHLWFELSLRRVPGNPRHSLYVSALPTINHWQRSLNSTWSRDSRLQYARTFYGLFNANNTETSLIEDLVDDEEGILEIVNRSVQGAVRSPSSIAISRIGAETPNVSSGQWMAFLNAHLQPHLLKDDDRLLLTDNVLFTLVNHLLARFTSDEVLRYVAWWFVQEYADLALGTVSGTGLGAEKSRHVFHIESFDFSWRRTEPERVALSMSKLSLESMALIFWDIKSALTRLLRSAMWMDEAARNEAIAIVSNITLEPWITMPRTVEMHAARQKTPRAVTIQSGTTRPAFDLWLEAARQHKRLAVNWPLDDALQQDRLHYSGLAEYNAWWNSVFLHPSAMSGPVFSTDAPKSAVYGGFAGILARRLVEAVDFRVGTYLDAKRNLHDWLSPGAREAFLDRIVCAEDDTVLMDVAAIEALLETQRGLLAERNNYYVLPGLGTRLTPAMLFFVAFCRARCGLARGCNQVVRHVRAFDQAFGCPTKTAKCSFFGD